MQWERGHVNTVGERVCECVYLCVAPDHGLLLEPSDIFGFGELLIASPNHGITIIECDIYVNISRIHSLGFPG